MADGSIIIDALISLKDFKKDLKKFDSLISAGMKGATVAIGAITTGMGIASKKALEFGTEYSKASNQLQAELGATADEMENLKSVMKDVYSENFGENMEDVADAIGLVKKQMGYFENNDDLKRATEDAIALRDTFEYDLNESVRAGSTLMGIYGINADEAFTLIAQGSQRGLDYSGELLDSINEYSVQFNKLGLDAEDMFNIFESGTKAGAFNLDKIGDAVKEFSIRAIDGSNTTIEGFKKLGLNSDVMAKKFAQGGDTAKQAFYDVIKRIREMDNKVEQSIVGVDLFGTMWEDLGPDVVTQLDGVKDAYDSTADTMQKINEVKYNDLESALEGIKRNLQTNLLLPISENVLPAFNKLANELQKALASEKTKKSIEKISGAISKFATTVAETAEKWLPKLINILAWILEHGTGIATTILAISAAIKAINKVNVTVKTVKSLAESLKKVKESGAGANSALSKLKGGLGTFGAITTGVAIGVTAVAAADEYLTEKIRKQYEETYNLADAIKETSKARQEATEAIDKQTNSSLSELDNIQNLKNELDTIVDKNGKIKKGYEDRASFIVNQLNSALGTEMSINKNVIKSYDKLSESIDKTIEKKKAQIIIEAKEEKYSNAIKNKTNDYENMVKAQEKVTEAQNNLNKKISEYKLNQSQIRGTTIETIMLKEIKETQKAYNAAVEAHKTATNAYKQDLNDITDYEEQYKLYQQGTSEAYQQMYLKNATVHGESTQTVVTNLKNTIPQIVSELQHYKEEYEKTGEDIYISQIDSSQKTLDTLTQNLIDITSKTGQLTPDLVEAWKTLGTLSHADYKKALDKVDPTTKAEIEKITGIIASDTSVENEAGKMGSDATKKFENNTNSEQSGINFVEGARRGINNSKAQALLFGAVTGLGASLIRKFNKSLDEHSPSKETEESGVNFVYGFVNGIISKAKKAYSSVIGLGCNLTDKFAESFDTDAINTNIEEIYSKMKTGIMLETNKLNANLTCNSKISNDSKIEVIVKNGDVVLDKKKVGRILAPEVSNTIKNGGIE